MMKTEKAPTSAATLTGAVESGRVCETVQLSAKNDTILAADSQSFHVADLLHPGAENAVPRRDLMALTGLSDRELRRQIERERRAGAWIISDNAHGYYLTDDPAEVQRFTRSMLHRSAEIAKTARILEGAAGLD